MRRMRRSPVRSRRHPAPPAGRKRRALPKPCAAYHGCGLSRDVTTKSVQSLPQLEQRNRRWISGTSPRPDFTRRCSSVFASCWQLPHRLCDVDRLAGRGECRPCLGSRWLARQSAPATRSNRSDELREPGPWSAVGGVIPIGGKDDTLQRHGTACAGHRSQPRVDADEPLKPCQRRGWGRGRVDPSANWYKRWILHVTAWGDGEQAVLGRCG